MSKDDVFGRMAFEAYCDAQIAHRVQTVLEAHTGIRASESVPDWIDLPSEVRVYWEQFAESIIQSGKKRELKSANAFKAAVDAYLEKGCKHEQG